MFPHRNNPKRSVWETDANALCFRRLKVEKRSWYVDKGCSLPGIQSPSHMFVNHTQIHTAKRDVGSIDTLKIHLMEDIQLSICFIKSQRRTELANSYAFVGLLRLIILLGDRRVILFV